MIVDVRCIVVVFFVKQKTAYEMRISDWSSDVCSSDLRPALLPMAVGANAITHRQIVITTQTPRSTFVPVPTPPQSAPADRVIPRGRWCNEDLTSKPHRANAATPEIGRAHV